MSGGSYNYICFTLQNECEGQMKDEELNEMLKDFCLVLHDLEWWQSCDYGEETYRKTVKKFKEKWFGKSHEERLEREIKKATEDFENRLRKTFGIKENKNGRND